jgi:hypothetical protein
MADRTGISRGLLDKKQTIITLQWLVAIVSSYFMLFNKGQFTGDGWTYGLVAVFLASALVFYRIPDAAFQHRSFDIVLFGANTALISLAIYQNHEAPWDLFLLYFFIIFIAAVGETLVKIVLGFIVISLVLPGFLLQQANR